MSEQPPPISILDARLAEIDRRLATIQTDLATGEPDSAPVTGLPPRVEVPVEVPEPSDAAAVSDAAPTITAASAPPRSEATQLIAELHELVGAHARLLDSMRELVSAYQRALATPAAVRELSLSAGPLKSTEALRGFEHALARIPEVGGVALRGYEGGDRAVVDVHLLDATS